MFFTKRKALIMIIICLVIFIFTYNDVKSEEVKEIIKNKMHILIVNHRLRKESHEEALKVKKILKENRFFHGNSTLPIIQLYL